MSKTYKAEDGTLWVEDPNGTHAFRSAFPGFCGFSPWVWYDDRHDPHGTTYCHGLVLRRYSRASEAIAALHTRIAELETEVARLDELVTRLDTRPGPMDDCDDPHGFKSPVSGRTPRRYRRAD